MADFSRYTRTSVLDYGAQYGTGRARQAIQAAISNGQLTITNTIVLRGRDRLDTLAGQIYGDARYWWVLAASSAIGWGLQVPPGTVINIPDLAIVASLVA